MLGGNARDQSRRVASGGLPTGAASQSGRDGRPSNGDAAAPRGAGSIPAPAISLPKGGGAIRGIGEKFGANPVTGTASLTVPISTSPGRSDFGPRLSLTYDAGAGNGPFGFGWSLSLPSITRKTDKGLPQYRDAEHGDVFILSGAEDLVPVLRADGTRFEDDTTVAGFTIYRYRPRVEGLFARIERWVQRDTSAVHWRSISRENVTSVYGRTDESRVADPGDPTRVFSWLICESYDNKGNAIVYSYAAEDDGNVDRSQAHERDRLRTANRYPKRIRYGNRVPHLAEPDLSDDNWLFEVVFDYDEAHVEDVTVDPPPPDAERRQLVRASAVPGRAWIVRPDPFSSYRAGFELRTYRRCRRILMFHRFEELGGAPYLVRSTELDYADLDEAEAGAVDAERAHQGSTRFGSFVRRITQSGYVRDDTQPSLERDGAAYSTYLKRSLPPLELEYSKAAVQEAVREIDPDSLEGLPHGLDGSRYQWVDLDGEGLSGILSEQSGAWLYKPNLGAGRFGPLEVVSNKPSLAALQTGRQRLLDLAGDGQLDLAAFDDPTPGFYERTHDQAWEPFKAFTSLPNVPWADPNLRFVDLNGDGHADVLIAQEGVFTWYPSLAEAGFGPAREMRQPHDEALGPRLVFSDGTESVYLADMSGDGLVDLVRVRNGEVCYWPNLGYGRFGPKVAMDNAPWFDDPDHFSQQRIRLADIDGSGTNDVIYLGRDGVRLYFNQCGNRWSDPSHLRQFPLVDDLSAVLAVDLLGNGTACLVWSSPMPGDARRPMRYVDLMGGIKPHLLVGATNNLGGKTTISYAPSTKFYLQDRAAGTPWITRLPFPVHCLEKVTVSDRWRGTTFSSTYSYHHGYFDGVEREFRGFGRVEQVDVESYGAFARGNAASPYITEDKTLYQPPVKTVTWYHTGALIDRERSLSQYEREYFPRWLEDADPDAVNVLGGFQEHVLPEPDLSPDGLSAEEWREAMRACKGMLLRQEEYELDVDALERGEQRPVKLFTTAYHNAQIQRLQPRGPNRHAVFLVAESEAVAYHYELDLRPRTLSPDPRIAHTLNLSLDEYGNVLQSVAVVYPRLGQHEDDGLSADDLARIRQAQRELHLAYTETRYTDDVERADSHRVRVPCEVLTYELTGLSPEDQDDRASPDPRDNRYLTLDELREYRLSPVHQAAGRPVEELAYHELPDPNATSKRLVEHIRMLFFDDDADTLVEPKPFGRLGRLGLPYETYRLALTEELLGAVFGARITPDVRARLSGASTSGYLSGAALAARFPGAGTAGQYWTRSGSAGFSPDAADRFYRPERYADPFGNVTTLEYDPNYDLFVRSSTDPLGNTTRVTRFDFRTLAAREVQDPNDNLTETYFDALGLATAMAVKGKGQEGDNLNGLDDVAANPPLGEVAAFFDAPAYDEARARGWLGNATARHVYSFGEARGADGSIVWGTHPAGACAILRERHVSQLGPGQQSPLQAAFEYSDSAGSVLVQKVQAEPATPGGPIRWVASGKTVLNNKGLPVKQYEPYFSSSEVGHGFEEPREEGVTAVVYYDAVGRVVRTERPDGAYSRAEIAPWQVRSYDANDTLAEPGNAWLAQHSAATATAEDRRAARLAAEHADTPAISLFDSLGREVAAVARNRVRNAAGVLADEKHLSFTRLDVEGKPLWLRDARRNLVTQYIVPPVPTNQPTDPVAGFVPGYDLAGNLLFQHGMDGGSRWTLHDAAGRPMLVWDVGDRRDANGALVSESRILSTRYDQLGRSIGSFVSGIDPEDPGREIQFEKIVYGDTPGNGLGDAERKRLNLRGRPYRRHDTAGVVTSAGRNPLSGLDEAFDFKGNLLRSTRQLVRDYRTTPDWSRDPPLETERFSSSTRYDALNRPIQHVAPHGDRPGTTLNVARTSYNEARLLARVDVWLEQAGEPAALFDVATATHRVITNVDYDARGRRTRIDYGNGVSTTYAYDPLTFRLGRLRTVRGADALQDLSYTYDPVGNVMAIADQAHDDVYHNGACAKPGAEYRYDALYRLTAASGREHDGDDLQPDWDDSRRVVRIIPNDCQALRSYVETYRYDAVGNILQMVHHLGSNPEQPGQAVWNRACQYAPDSNRLLATRLPGDPSGLPSYTETPGYGARYAYDRHGNMTSMPHLPALEWDFLDRLRASRRAVVNGGAAETTHYVYDATGQRVRKVTESGSGARKEERIYLGSFELYRRYAGNAPTVVLERESLHVMDERQRVALIETRTVDARNDDPAPRQVVRYQHANQIGSATLELDQQAKVISYEEYHPYGSTAYQAVRGQTETPKRYRYTGKERDEETGLSYHGARYYAPWLARWTSADPRGLVDGANLFAYGRDNPILYADPSGTRSNLDLLSDHMQEQRNEDVKKAADDPFNAAQVTREEVADYMKLTHGDFIKKYGEGRFLYVKDAARSLPADALASLMPSPPSKEGPAVVPPLQSASAERAQRLAREKQERQQAHPTAYDVMVQDSARVARAVDPSGMGIVKAPLTVALVATGEDIHEAEAKAAQVDAVVGVVVAFSGAGARKGSASEPVGVEPPPGEYQSGARVSGANEAPAQQGLQQRARAAQLQVVGVDRIPQRRVTTVAVEPAIDPSGKPVNLIGASVDINPREIFAPYEVLVPRDTSIVSGVNEHAELQIIIFADANGYTLLPGMSPSRPFCGNCAFWCRHYGIAPWDAMVSSGPGQPPVRLNTLTDQDLANRAHKPRYK